MNPNLRVNKTNFHMKGFAPGLALKQRRNATRKLPIEIACSPNLKSCDGKVLNLKLARFYFPQ